MRTARRTLGRMAAIAAVVTASACNPDNTTGTGGTPASVTANVTVPAAAVIASPVHPAPAVLVKSASGAPMPNVRVTFLVTGGGGTVAGASQLSDANGVATVGQWTLGTTVGPQTLVATAGGLTVTFTVEATNSCTITAALAVGDTVTGDLSTSPCAMGDGTAAQSWSFQQASGQGALSFTMTSTAAPFFNTVVVLHRDAFTRFDNIIAGNDNDPKGSTTDSRLNILLAPGNYVLSGVNVDPGITGPFSITADNWSGEFANCDPDYVTPGITTTQTMDSSCVTTSTQTYLDLAGLYLKAGQTVQIDMSSTAFDPALEFYDGSTGSLLLSDDNGGGGTSARITYTAPVSNIYVIVPTSPLAHQSGAYTLSVSAATGGTPVGPASTAARSARATIGAVVRGTNGGRTAFGWPTSHWLQPR